MTLTICVYLYGRWWCVAFCQHFEWELFFSQQTAPLRHYYYTHICTRQGPIFCRISVCVCESSVLLPIVGIKAMLLHWAPFLSTMYHAQECKWSRRPGHTNTYNDVVEDIFVICYNSHFGMRVHIPLSEQMPLKKLFLTF